MARFDYNTTYPIRDVMAYSVMAHRINGDEYLTNCFYNDNDNIIAKYPNKDIMLYSMTGVASKNTLQGKTYHFENVPDEEDYAVADDIVSYYQGLMLKAMGSKINEFEQKVLGLVKAGIVRANEFGIVACLPKSYYRSIERDAVESKQRELSDASQFVGKVGETIDIAIDILRVNFIAKLNCWVVNARNADNLVVFFTSNGETFKDMTSGTIRGRVKRHQTSNYHEGKETVLNYVKVMSNV